MNLRYSENYGFIKVGTISKKKFFLSPILPSQDFGSMFNLKRRIIAECCKSNDINKHEFETLLHQVEIVKIIEKEVSYRIYIQ